MNPFDSIAALPAWIDAAPCAQIDPEAWFPENGGSSLDAKRICGTCDARTKCLEWALANPACSQFGVWGGTDASERRHMRGRAA